jgi:amino-acid N-acetyltransferase
MIRRAGTADVPGITKLLEENGLPSDDLRIAGADAEFFVDADPLVGDTAGISGVAGVEYYGRTALVRSVAVAASSRSRGIGRQLVDAAIDAARRRGCADAVLLTESAGAWFARLGFEKIGRESLRPEVLTAGQVSGARCASAAVMRLELQPLPGRQTP